MCIPTDPRDPQRGWFPDISILEDAGAGFLSNTKYTDMVLYSNGSWYNDFPGELLVTFNPLVDYYPFDVQNITMTLGSAAYADDFVNVAA